MPDAAAESHGGTPPQANARVRVSVRGRVQGVGFRPFVYRLAQEAGLTGWVVNTTRGVVIEVEGPPAATNAFVLRLANDPPPIARIQSLEQTHLDPAGYDDFCIRESDEEGPPTAHVTPDVATCPSCRAEIFDPRNRRHLYPFTNCTDCGPRWSILERLPYDRANTTMRRFSMCAACRAEYEDPLDRRYHAQPNACPDCGPRVAFWSRDGREVAARCDALAAAADAIRGGAIVGVKGIGGFHLVVDARDDKAVARLRDRKHREEKPFALMFPSITSVEEACDVSPIERRLLRSPEAPIVLLARSSHAPSPGGPHRAHHPPIDIARSVAPDHPTLGAMLPYSPLHHILLHELGFPVVATSGNLADEPICTDERDAVARLGEIADAFLVHDRPIARPIDDSVARVVLGRELVLRRARGFAPLPVVLTEDAPPLLAVGAHQKNTVAVALGRDVFVSQHIGDLETAGAEAAFRDAVDALQEIYTLRPERVACDLHPDYASTRFARRLGVPVTPVQHHHAHVASCMVENDLDGPVLGISWDGTGLGTDREMWGGEFLVASLADFRRAGHLRRFRLAGGESAAREPRRAAVGLLFEQFGPAALARDDLEPIRSFPPAERALLRAALERGINAPYTTSIGRLFDAVASLVGIAQRISYEGQAAAGLEFAAIGHACNDRYGFELLDGPEEAARRSFVLDWEPALRGVLWDLAHKAPAGVIAARFHNMLVEAIVLAARRTRLSRVVLSGGCFQNAHLLELAVTRLREEGFRAYWPQRIPPNDGGISLGQIAVASRLGRAG